MLNSHMLPHKYPCFELTELLNYLPNCVWLKTNESLRYKNMYIIREDFFFISISLHNADDRNHTMTNFNIFILVRLISLLKLICLHQRSGIRELMYRTHEDIFFFFSSSIVLNCFSLKNMKGCFLYLKLSLLWHRLILKVALQLTL